VAGSHLGMPCAADVGILSLKDPVAPLLPIGFPSAASRPYFVGTRLLNQRVKSEGEGIRERTIARLSSRGGVQLPVCQPDGTGSAGTSPNVWVPLLHGQIGFLPAAPRRALP
jgi:hypothetical protein